jgi:hypothetical protein
MSMDGDGPSGFAPGQRNHGVANAPVFPDAADALVEKVKPRKKSVG